MAGETHQPLERAPPSPAGARPRPGRWRWCRRSSTPTTTWSPSTGPRCSLRAPRSWPGCGHGVAHRRRPGSRSGPAPSAGLARGLRALAGSRTATLVRRGARANRSSRRRRGATRGPPRAQRPVVRGRARGGRQRRARRAAGDRRVAISDGSWSRLKVCPGDDCGWAFYDESRNRAGRWCSMSVCGGREKARAHYRRQRAQGP